MDAREAKREACWRAATLIDTSMEAGWPFNPNEDGSVNPLAGLDHDDEMRVAHALYALIRELANRGKYPEVKRLKPAAPQQGGE